MSRDAAVEAAIGKIANKMRKRLRLTIEELSLTWRIDAEDDVVITIHTTGIGTVRADEDDARELLSTLAQKYAHVLRGERWRETVDVRTYVRELSDANLAAKLRSKRK